MNKTTKTLLKENNKMQEQMSKISNFIYTDMVVYLRGSDLTEYNQELVRRDIIQMIIDGEKRGDDISKTLGGNYKEICDEIISVFPARTIKEKTLSFIHLTLLCVWVLGFVYTFKTFLYNILLKREIFNFTLSFGDMINMVLIVFLANIIINIICKNAFKTPMIKNKILSFLISWVVCFIVIGGMFAIAYLLKTVVVDVNIIWVAAITAVIFITEKMVGSRI